MSTLTNVDYTSYSDDELEQAIKDIQKVKINRKASRSNKQKIFIKSLSNQENESLSKDQNMLKAYIIGYLIGKPGGSSGHGVGSSYNTQDNSNNNCSLGYNFNTLTPINRCSKDYIGGFVPNNYRQTVDTLISFSYDEI